MELQIAEIEDAKELNRALEEIDDGSDWCRLTQPIQDDARRALSRWMRALRERSSVVIKSYLDHNQPERVIELCRCIEGLEAVDGVDISLRDELKQLRECVEEIIKARGQLKKLSLKKHGWSYFGKVNEVRKALEKAAALSHFDNTAYYEQTKRDYDAVTGPLNHPVIRWMQVVAWIIVGLFLIAVFAVYVMTPTQFDSYQALGDGSIDGLELYYKVPRFVTPGQSDVVSFGITNTTGRPRKLRVEVIAQPPLQPEIGQQLIHIIEVDENKTLWTEYGFTIGPDAKKYTKLVLAFEVNEVEESSTLEAAPKGHRFTATNPVEVRRWSAKQFKSWVDVRAMVTAMIAGAFLAVSGVFQRLLRRNIT